MKIARPDLLIAVFLASCLWSAHVRAADYRDLIPAKSGIVLSINVQDVLTSSLLHKLSKTGKLLKMLADDAKKQQTKGEKNETNIAQEIVRQFFGHYLKPVGIRLRDLDLEPAQDIDRIVIAVVKANEPLGGLVVVQGKFKSQKFAASLRQRSVKNPKGVKSKRMHGCDVWQLFNIVPASKSPLIVALHKNNTLLLSMDKENLGNALRSLTKKSKKAAVKSASAGLPTALRTLLDKTGKESVSCVARAEIVDRAVKKLVTNPELKKALDNPFVALVEEMVGPLFKSFTKEVVAVGAGMKFGKKFVYRVSLKAKDVKSARQLRRHFNQISLMAVLFANRIENKNFRIFVPLFMAMDARTEESVVHMEGQVGPKVFAKIVKLAGY